MKRQILQDIARMDAKRASNSEECVTSILTSIENDHIRSIIERKCPTGNYLHLKTFNAWQNRLGNATVADLEYALKYLESVDASNDETSNEKLSKESVSTIEEHREEDDSKFVVKADDTCDQKEESVTKDDDIVSLASVNLSEKRKEEIGLWYTSKLNELNSNKDDLRPEQYRRRKAQLRVEYWAKMDVEMNNATPTVINMG